MVTGMKAVVIGATGHTGSYMVPALVRRGYEVVAISRGGRQAYTKDSSEWKSVQSVTADRKTLEASGSFGRFVISFNPDVICDLICYTMPQAMQMAEAAAGNVRHLIQIGSIWAYGYAVSQPTRESDKKNPLDDYGRNKGLIEDYLCGLTKLNKLTATVIHPGHISGRGWAPINPQGNTDMEVFRKIKRGEEIILPDNGLWTLHHVHAEDIAALTLACIDNYSDSAGEAFNSVCETNLTLRGYTESVYRFFGQSPAIRYESWQTLKPKLDNNQAAITQDHMDKSPCCSMEKARRTLGFVPRYSSLQTVLDSISWLEQNGGL
jgi:nucleoside-diphosphate-sugar epimerase